MRQAAGVTGRPAARGSLGWKIIAASVGVGVAGALPLAVYRLVGPADGNPIGLGLLFVLGALAAKVGVGLGLVELLIERLRR